MWQFMPTGAYGLARNGYVDERFDPLEVFRGLCEVHEGRLSTSLAIGILRWRDMTGGRATSSAR